MTSFRLDGGRSKSSRLDVREARFGQLVGKSYSVSLDANRLSCLLSEGRQLFYSCSSSERAFQLTSSLRAAATLRSDIGLIEGSLGD